MNRFLAVMPLFVLTACASTDVQGPLVGEVRTQTIKVGVPVLCPRDDQLPPRPGSASPEETADVERLMAGIRADAEAYAKHIDDIALARRACAAAITKGEKP